MSFNITVDVDEEGNAKFVEDPSYTKTAKPGRYVISGHFVEEGGGGTEYISASFSDTKGGGGNLNASGGHNVPSPQA